MTFPEFADKSLVLSLQKVEIRDVTANSSRQDTAFPRRERAANRSTLASKPGIVRAATLR
jgi:hypothetical protein